ncbi:MAG: MBL fold metallo-hydrolase [Candidatus Portnoybacteria bacterium]|nr:MBL fold metallo-hydrolase [Candidatus Portnoybacteria bacterium]MDD4982814.1 MBL fold metallo-hydrolase [Candidatus Portnoybacteria bacterium]
MVITWYGQSCFKIQSGETVLFTDPFAKEIGLTPPRGQANIVTISHNHFDHNNSEAINGGSLVIDEPGEYESKGVDIKGILSFHDDKEGKERGTNTIYIIDMEGMKICHLGDLGQAKLTAEQVEKIDGVDILMIPVGGTYTIDEEMAAEIINQIEPRIVIPMHYKIPGLTSKIEGVDAFLKEMGVAKKETVDKLTLKKKDLPEGDMQVITMRI